MTFILAVLFFQFSLSFSSTIYVNINNGQNGDGKSWSSAFTSVQSAISNANSGDEIWIAQGTYYPTDSQSSTDRAATFSLSTQLSVYGGFKGTENTIKQRPDPLMETILSGNIGNKELYKDNSYHIVTILDDTLLFDGLIFEGGYSHNDSVSDYTSCATCFGGAIYQNSFQKRQQDAVNLHIHQCQFRNNSALSGGAIFGFGSPNYRITNSVFEYNSAAEGTYKGGYGGAIMIAMWGNMTVTNTIFRFNTASGSGGASHCDYGMYCTYTDCTFDSNTVAEGNGAALTLIDRDSQRGSSELTVDKCTFKNNVAYTTKTSLGGAVYIFDNDAFGFVTNSIFDSNSAGYGGAMSFYGDSHCKGCCKPPSNNTFSNNVGKNGDNDCYLASFPYFNSVPNTITNDELMTYLQSLYDDKGKYSYDAPAASENIVYVNKQSKAANPDGTSWSNAFDVLQDGINAAEEILNNDRKTSVEIWVVGNSDYEKYKYVPQTVPKWYNRSEPYFDESKSKIIEIPNDIKLFGGFDGTETKRNDRNFVKNPTFIDGFVSTTDQVYQVVYVHENVWIDGFMIANGYAQPGPPKLLSLSQTNPDQILYDQTPLRGAGIFSNVSSLNVANCLFFNHFSTKGSGIYVLGNPQIFHNVTVYNLGFVNNYATDRGGALALDLRAEVNCIGCKFWSNVCSHKGGAVYSDFSSHSVFDECVFYNK